MSYTGWLAMTTFVFGTNTWTDETKPFASTCIWYLVTSKGSMYQNQNLLEVDAWDLSSSQDYKHKLLNLCGLINQPKPC